MNFALESFPDFGLESFDEQHVDIARHTRTVSELELMRAKIATEGMSYDDALLLNKMVPGIFDDRTTKKFTQMPSRTNISLALEAMDWKRGGVILAITGAIFALIWKIITWLTGLGTKVGGRDTAAGDANKADAQIKRNLDNVAQAGIDKVAPNLHEADAALVKLVGIFNNLPTQTYQNEFVKRVEAGTYVGATGNKATWNELSDAATHYRDGAFGYDKNQSVAHAIIGSMLVEQRAKWSPMALMFDYRGQREAAINWGFIFALERAIEYVSDVIDGIIQLERKTHITMRSPGEFKMKEMPENYGDQTGRSYYDTEEPVNIPLDNIYAAMRDSNKDLQRRHATETNFGEYQRWFGGESSEDDITSKTPMFERMSLTGSTETVAIVARAEKYRGLIFSCWKKADGSVITPGQSNEYKNFINAFSDSSVRKDIDVIYGRLFPKKGKGDILTTKLNDQRKRLKEAEASIKNIVKRSDKEPWLVEYVGRANDSLSPQKWQSESEVHVYAVLPTMQYRLNVAKDMLSDISRYVTIVLNAATSYQTCMNQLVMASKIGLKK